MTISKTYFLTLFDEFKNIPHAKIDVYLELAALQVSKKVWCELYNVGVAYLAAHMLVSGGGLGGAGGSAGGPLTQEAVGDLSRSFGTVGVQGSGDEGYNTTRYGQEFLNLRRQVVMGFRTTGNPQLSAGTVVADETIG